ncbi:winged helix-turn-helix domain-containing protein [Actinoallomurus sp. NPDC052274]|uniref:winged helix-turn-helix domain-containing protein n=1 Tax=Actinoallomurus sp. NPDC052274 TaxID=3155420 RepID=UPI00342D019D
MTRREEAIARLLQERIESGEWKPRRQIPSQRRLAVELNASPGTVHRAVANLRERGYLWTLPHKGSYTRPPEHWGKAAE